MNTYSAWECDDGYVFVQGEGPPVWADRTPMPGVLRLLHVIEAESWEEACREYHRRMGWEPYREESPDG